jgi:ABC-type nickel/cobalt efflux system permease component RcnA
MFCPKCGQPDQTPESYCRQCGIFLPDLNKPVKGPIKPEEHVKVNMVFSGMTVVASFTLSALLYSILGFRSDTHWLIYMTAALLLAMGIWHTQVFWRTLQLRKHFKKPKRTAEIAAQDSGSDKALNQADFGNIVPASITDRTTRHLTTGEGSSAKAHHEPDRAV